MVTIALGTNKLEHRYLSMLNLHYWIRHPPGPGNNESPCSIYGRILLTAGAHNAHPITLGWLANNVSGHYNRAVSTAIPDIAWGLRRIHRSNVFVDSQAPAYKMEYGVSLGCICITVVTVTVFVLGLRAENRKRDRVARD